MSVGNACSLGEVADAAMPLTDVVRRALLDCAPSEARDLRFLERWEADPEQGLAATLRAGQIRRANPVLAAAIRAELAARARSGALRRGRGG